MEIITLRKIGEFLAERASRQTDVPFQRQMQDLAIIKRARFLTNSIEKRPTLKRFFLQSFEMEMERIDKTDECSEELPEGCDIAYRTKEIVPEPLRIGVHPFEYVGALGGHHPYGWTTFGNEKYLKHLCATGKKPRYTYINDRVYVFNDPNSEKIRIEGVFGDPRALAEFKQCGTNKPCFSETERFPIDTATLELIIRDIVTVELRLASREEDIQLKVDKNV